MTSPIINSGTLKRFVNLGEEKKNFFIFNSGNTSQSAIKRLRICTYDFAKNAQAPMTVVSPPTQVEGASITKCNYRKKYLSSTNISNKSDRDSRGAVT